MIIFKYPCFGGHTHLYNWETSLQSLLSFIPCISKKKLHLKLWEFWCHVTMLDICMWSDIQYLCLSVREQTWPGGSWTYTHLLSVVRQNSAVSLLLLQQSFSFLCNLFVTLDIIMSKGNVSSAGHLFSVFYFVVLWELRYRLRPEI